MAQTGDGLGEKKQATNDRKRKDAPLSNNTSDDKPTQKKAKFERFAGLKNARNIGTQSSFKAFKNGELDVDKFVKSREYEIRALEQGLVNSKKGLSKRAFQLVPKELRRRTASHNAKRVPKRLRNRARREMNEDNTPVVTARRRKSSNHMRFRTETAKKLRNFAKSKAGPAAIPKLHTQPTPVKTRAARIKHAKLADVPSPKAKFRKRQREKSWLPTHLFHTKRARMTPPNEPLWRFALPLTPTAKSYRATHRAANDRGAVAFDMSYVSTILLTGRYASLLGMLQALDADGSIDRLRISQRWKWLLGETAIDLHVHHRDTPRALIAPVTVIFCSSPTLAVSTSVDDLDKLRGSLFLRVHPSAFLELWEELLRLSKMVKPTVSVEDLRYEIGCIEVIGPASTEALFAVLKPCSQDDEAALSQITGLSNISLLPAGTVIDLEVQDPRLCQKARLAKHVKQPSILQTTAYWNVTAASRSGALFDRRKRVLVGKGLPSQKAVNRRKSDAPVGSDPATLDNDPRIPILLYTTPNSGEHTSLNKWTVLLPWKCVLPVWYSLIYLPLSAGLQPRFGGLTEIRDISLAHGIPWFPADYPASRTGWQWEIQERQRRKIDWMRRPKSKRVNWDRLELGNGHKGEVGEGWACDWTRMLRGPVKPGTVIDTDIAKPTLATSVEGDDAQLCHVSLAACRTLARLPDPAANTARSSLVQVRIVQISRGIAQQCARVYRLPASSELRKRWLSTHTKYKRNPARSSRGLPRASSDVPTHIEQKQLAQSLLEAPQAGQPEWPPCPGEPDLIGFVTAGNYDLGAGRGTAIGSIMLIAELEARAATASTLSINDKRLCIVRNSGETIGRLATWQLS